MEPGTEDTCCDLCGETAKWIKVYRQSGLSSVFSGAGLEESACSTGLVKEQVLLYFVAKKLLKFEDEQFLELLVCSKREEGNDSVGRRSTEVKQGEMGAFYFGRFCGNCEDIISEAIGVHRKVVELRRKISELGNGLKETIRMGGVKKTGWSDGKRVPRKITRKIATFVCPEFENRDHYEDAVRTALKPDILESVKMEAEDSSSYYGGIEVDYGLQEDNCHDDRSETEYAPPDNLTVTPITSPLPNTPQEIGHRKRKRRKGTEAEASAGEEVSDSDSDFDPEVAVPKSTHKKRKRKCVSAKITIGGNKKCFTCNICNMVQRTPNGFKQHMKAHEESAMVHGNKYDCSKCKYPALSEGKLRYHLTVAHQAMHKNTCSVCGFVGSRRGIYEKHMNEKHNIQVWTPITDKEDDDKNAVEQESIPNEKNVVDDSNNDASQAGDDPEQFRCEKCNTVYKTLKFFQRHLDAHRMSAEQNHKFDCDECGFPAVNEKYLRYHKRKHHQQYLMRTCTLCGHQVKRLDQMKLHMMNKHGRKQSGPGRRSKWTDSKLKEDASDQDPASRSVNQEGFRCSICNMVQNTARGFRQHMKAHEESARVHGNKYDCPKCKYPALSEWKLRYHLTVAHQATHKNTCSICGFVGSRRWIYDKHMKEKHNIQVWTPIDKSDEGHIKIEVESSTQNEPGSPEGRDLSQLFQCDKCSSVYKTRVSFRQHQDAHRISTELNHKFDCDQCGFPANSEKRLRFHKRKQHQQHLLRTCALCGHQVKRLDQMKLHMAKKHGGGGDHSGTGRKSKWRDNKLNDRFQCQLCKYSYSNSGYLKRHMEEHEKSDEMDRKWECTRCAFPCLSEKRLRRHVQLRHEKTPPTCSICQRTFGRQYLLKAHMLMHKQFDKHQDPTTGLFSCDICPKQLNSLTGLVLHKAQMHGGASTCPGEVADDSHLCPHCGRCYTTMLQLRRHIRTLHEGRRTHTCDICGKGIEGKAKLEEHRKVHEENRVKEFVCDICGSSYSHKATLIKHVEKYHSERTSVMMAGAKKTYKCKFCAEVFPFKLLFDKHLESVHQDMYTHQCDQCNKSYISASSLRLHKEISHGEGGGGKHSCEYCGKQFVHKHYVICHYKSCSVKLKVKLDSRE